MEDKSMQNTYRYPALFESCEEGGYTVTFPDLPGIVTEGDDVDEAIAMQKKRWLYISLGWKEMATSFQMLLILQCFSHRKVPFILL